MSVSMPLSERNETIIYLVHQTFSVLIRYICNTKRSIAVAFGACYINIQIYDSQIIQQKQQSKGLAADCRHFE